MCRPNRSRHGTPAAARAPLLAALGAALLVSLAVPATAGAGERIARLALFPVENLSGDSAPAAEVTRLIVERLAARGVAVLDARALDDFMTRHRVRYAAGIDAATAAALRQETGVEAIVIATIELSSAAVPPRLALIVRLVSIVEAPAVVWADDVGVAGDDSPGFLELGVVNDYPTLLTRALHRLCDSLAGYLETGAARTPRRASKFRPKTKYRGLTLDEAKRYSIAVVPFVNLSDRRNAGDILALLFMRHLSSVAQFRVADAGVVRQQLLDARIIMDGGLSITDADTVAALIDADFVLGGRVLRYDDPESAGGRTSVEFSAVLIEKRTRRVVWSSDSYNDGADGVRFFERGTSRTAHVMATQMVRLTTDLIVGRGR